MDISDKDFCEKFKGKKIKIVGHGFVDTPDSIYRGKTKVGVSGEYKDVKVKGGSTYRVWKEQS
jgi:hypothetical protein